MRGIRRGDFAILVMKDDWHKKTCLYVSVGQNSWWHCATFRSEESAKDFLRIFEQIVFGNEVTE